MIAQDLPALPETSDRLTLILWAIIAVSVTFGRTATSWVRNRKDTSDADRKVERESRQDVLQSYKDALDMREQECVRLRAENEHWRGLLLTCQQERVDAQVAAVRYRAHLEIIEDSLTDKWMQEETRKLLEKHAPPALPPGEG